MKRIKVYKTILLLLLVALCGIADAQVVVKGTVYDKQVRVGVPNVSVLSSSGIGTITDSLGRYSIRVPDTDSLYFSYLGKTTSRFVVKLLPPDEQLDISLPVSVDVLPSITVRQPSYRLDSLNNRKEYAKVFDGEPAYMGAPSGGFGLGIGLDLIFNAKKIKRFERFKARLEREERDKYIDHRFTKALVRRITGLTAPALDTFMVQYRPTYEHLKEFETDYEYYEYIKYNGESFQYFWKRDHPNEVADTTSKAASSN